MQFLFPIPSTSIVTQSFAEHVHRAKVNNWQNYNGGIDWAVNSGTPVVAAQDGTVTVVRNDATGYGTHVRIQHDGGFMTIYGHMMDYSVRAGDKVRAGDVIGRSDNTGNSTGPHLHFELRKNNVAVDPAPLLVLALTPGGGEPSGPVEPTEPELPAGEEPKEFPQLPMARVVSSIGLNMRMGPGVNHSIVGFLPMGTQVEVLRRVKEGGEVWLQIGYHQFAAMQVAGEVLAVWVAAPPSPAGDVRPRKSRKKKTTK